MALRRGLPRRPLQKKEKPSKITSAERFEELIERVPLAVRLRTFARDFFASYQWWGYFVPLLLWIGWRTYKQERRIVLYNRAARQRFEAYLRQQEEAGEQSEA